MKKQFPYSPGGLPFVPITLEFEKTQLTFDALIDSGATVNVLPYDFGLQLGLSWEMQRRTVETAGFLQGAPVYAVRLLGQIDSLSPMLLGFAWSQKTRDEIPLILGQQNFFEHVKITFDGRRGIVELAPYDSI